MPADRGGLCSILPPGWGEYECLYLIFVPTLLVFLFYIDLFLRKSSDDTRRVITLAISEFVVLAAIQFVLYASEGVTPQYYVSSLQFDDVVSSILFRLPIPFVNILNQFEFYRIAERMCMDSNLFLWRFIV